MAEVVLHEEDGMKSPCAVNLYNAMTVSQQVLGRRVAQLSAARMNEVCAALRFSLWCPRISPWRSKSPPCHKRRDKSGAPSGTKMRKGWASPPATSRNLHS